jgi:hypothetical protein
MPARCAKPRAVRVGLRALLLVRCCRRSVAVPRGRAWQRAHFWCDRGRPRVRTEGHISEINIVPLAKAVPAERRESVTRQLCFYEGGWASAGAVLRGGGPGSASIARRSGGVLRAVLAGMRQGRESNIAKRRLPKPRYRLAEDGTLSMRDELQRDTPHASSRKIAAAFKACGTKISYKFVQRSIRRWRECGDPTQTGRGGSTLRQARLWSRSG